MVQLCLCDHAPLLQGRPCALNALILCDASFSSAAFKPFTPASEPNLATKIYQDFDFTMARLHPTANFFLGSSHRFPLQFLVLCGSPACCSRIWHMIRLSARTWPVTTHHQPQLSKCAQLCKHQIRMFCIEFMGWGPDSNTIRSGLKELLVL